MTGLVFEIGPQPDVAAADHHDLHVEPAFDDLREVLLRRAPALGSEEQEHRERPLGEAQTASESRRRRRAAAELGVDGEGEEFHAPRGEAFPDDLAARALGEHHVHVEAGREPHRVRVERLGVEHHGRGVELVHVLQRLEVVREGEVRGHHDIGPFALEVGREARQVGGPDHPVEDLHEEGIVRAVVEGVDQRGVPQAEVPVGLVDEREEPHPQRPAEVDHADLEVGVVQQVELALDGVGGGEVAAADVDGVEIDFHRGLPECRPGRCPVQ